MGTSSIKEKSKVFAYWGNDGNTTTPDYDIWSDYEGVWHLTNAIDSSTAERNATTEGSVSLGNTGLIGKGLTLSSSGNLVITGTGIPADQARTVSLWMSHCFSGQLAGWGDSSNNWAISWDNQGPRVATGNGGIRQGGGLWFPDNGTILPFPTLNGVDLNQQEFIGMEVWLIYQYPALMQW